MRHDDAYLLELPVEEDPAYKLVGLGTSKVRHVADKHDEYIVDEIEKETNDLTL